MAKYQKYAEYKDSGVEWLGDIPEEWSIVSIARVSNKITNGYVGATRDIFYDSGLDIYSHYISRKIKLIFIPPIMLVRIGVMKKASLFSKKVMY